MARSKRKSRSRSRSRSRKAKRGYELRTVPELRALLKSRGLKTDGRKATLVRRLRRSRKTAPVPKYQLSRLATYKRTPGAVQRVTGIPCSWLPKGAIQLALEAYFGHKHAHSRKFKQRREYLCARLARAILHKPMTGPMDLEKIKQKFLKAHPQKVDKLLVKEVKKAAKKIKKVDPVEADAMTQKAKEHEQHMKELKGLAPMRASNAQATSGIPAPPGLFAPKKKKRKPVDPFANIVHEGSL